MRLENQFRVPADCARTWEYLADLRNVAPCLPGASIEAGDRTSAHGKLTLRIGPMKAVYAGRARFVLQDGENRLATIEATGAEERRGGTATARIRARLTAVPGGTAVDLATELNLTGRVAQLGRGPIEAVGARLTTLFATSLAERLENARTQTREISDLVTPQFGDESAAAESRTAAPRTAHLARRAALGAGCVAAALVLVAAARRFTRRSAL